ncbi:MAG: serine aminopeptidase domain-containing protein [Gammaproteobacteria bacterium]
MILKYFAAPLLMLPLLISTGFADEIKIVNFDTVRTSDKSIIKSQLVKSDNSPQSILLYVQDSKCKSSAAKFFNLTNTIDNSVAKLYVEKIGESDSQYHHGKCSESFLSNSSIEQRIADYQHVISSLRANADWWDKKLYIIGESEGGLIAGLIAANMPETQKLAILNFGGGMTMSEAWIANLTKTMQASGKTSAEIDEMQLSSAKFFKEKISQSNSKSELAPNITFKWWASVVDIRLSDTLTKIEFPIYIAHGTDDNKIPVESAQKVADLFSNLNKTNLVYNEYTGSIQSVSKCKINSTTKPVLTEAINWLLN